MKSFSVASLNLHYFKEWEYRFPKILYLFKTVNPDIILTQETQLDPSFDSRNQIEILNNELHYPYSMFSKAEIRTNQKGKDLPFPVEHGLGIMSRYPIIDIVVHELDKNKEDKEKRIAVTYTIDIYGEHCKITNVHFSNRDDWALNHFKQVLKITKAESNIIGDFNIHGFNFEKYQDLYKPSYVSSYDYKKYISFPSEQTTFDYALINNSMFSIKSVDCREEEVSDHRMLIVEMIKK